MRQTRRERWLDRLAVILWPAYWIQNDLYNEAWDRALTALLDAGVEFTDVSHYRATLGPFRDIWIQNQPYASFELHGVRPRRATIRRAYRVLSSGRFTVPPDRVTAMVEALMSGQSTESGTTPAAVHGSSK